MKAEREKTGISRIIKKLRERIQTSEGTVSLSAVLDVLSELGCENLTSVNGEDGIKAVEWAILYQRSWLGITKSGSITPQTLVITRKDDELRYACKSGEEIIGSRADSLYDPLGHLGTSSREGISPIRAVYEFLAPFVLEDHRQIANTDVFGFQFLRGCDPKDKDVKVRIGGVEFTFAPNRKSNVLAGKLKVNLPRNGKPIRFID
ncbi:hypothetical protein M1146_02270 [Patescibacteria group bacterium]|nr:hypothetical protein [Patescibacteria group bacterium]